ncbi:MAG TPA: endo alpha-1,4 polygalactosaminidase [Erysipelotrichaceae bacterium]|nr:endo alpha-1,4 polygalactosaminidase [Erysipelotrichaceae bacterium]
MDIKDTSIKFAKGKKLLILVVFGVILVMGGCTDEKTYRYGVFLGINENESEIMDLYETVVIEPAEFSRVKIKELQAAGKTVYGYLNIGSVEEYRSYFDRFKDLYLGIYQDWPDEQWIDVSSLEWQNFIVFELGKQYVEMGLDGLFLDNADVYYRYPSEEIFQGLCSILQGLKEYDLILIINGGDLFVSRCLEENTALSLFDGINQETVFTCINFDNKSFGVQSEEETEYFKNYIEKVKENGLSVYLLEYGANRQLAIEIDSYCLENGFSWYNASNLDLR